MRPSTARPSRSTRLADSVAAPGAGALADESTEHVSKHWYWDSLRSAQASLREGADAEYADGIWGRELDVGELYVGAGTNTLETLGLTNASGVKKRHQEVAESGRVKL